MHPSSTIVPVLLLTLFGAFAAGSNPPASNALKPAVITEPTRHDTDDPAFWIHPTDRAKSLVIGTDKDTDGALYVYDLDGTGRVKMALVRQFGRYSGKKEIEAIAGPDLIRAPDGIARP